MEHMVQCNLLSCHAGKFVLNAALRTYMSGRQLQRINCAGRQAVRELLSPAGRPHRESTCCHITCACAAETVGNRRSTVRPVCWLHACCPLAGSRQGDR